MGSSVSRSEPVPLSDDLPSGLISGRGPQQACSKGDFIRGSIPLFNTNHQFVKVLKLHVKRFSVEGLGVEPVRVLNRFM